MSTATGRVRSVIIYAVAVYLFPFCTVNLSLATIDEARETPSALVGTAGVSQALSHTDNSVAGRNQNKPGVSPDSVTTKDSNDNDSVTLQNIRSILNEELQKTTQLLESIDQKVSPRGFITRVAREAPTKIFWDFILKPVLGWLFAAIGTLSIVGKLTVTLRLRKARQEGRTSPIAERANSVITVVWYALIILFIVVFVLIASMPNTTLQISSTAMPDIADRLTRIEELLGSLQASSPNPPINANPVLLMVAIFSILGFIIAALARSRYGILLWQAPPVSPSTAGVGDASKLLVTPVVLALILLILPYPADTFLLPFILTYFIAAFLDLLHVYPNPGILRIVLKRYSILIYVAYYGAWSAFFYAIQRVLNPFWTTIADSTLRDYGTTLTILEYIWWWAPIIMAALAALPGWRQVRRTVANDRIPALQEELLSQEAAMHRSKEEGGA